MNVPGPLRIEASKRPHAESLQALLSSYAPKLIRTDGSWQIEIRHQPDAAPLLELIATLGQWLEEQQLASLTLHIEDYHYTLLRRGDHSAPLTDEAALRLRIAQLETALESRAVLEQAKGVLAERHEISPDTAFQVLREAARSSRSNLRALAQRVLDEPETPNQITPPPGRSATS
jgi:hypothetical protein